MAALSNLGFAATLAISTLKTRGEMVDTGRWQGVPTAGKPDLMTKEILDLNFEVNLERGDWHNESIDEYFHQLAIESGCNELWAMEHFQERVGGVPMNPDPSYERWPWWHGQTDDTRTTEIDEPFRFTHTYSERFWPRQAGETFVGKPVLGTTNQHRGVRFRYGDYGDVLDLLAEDPYTRQAYLPIFFPEDTGAVHRGRIPCSLGYHFLLRGNHLHCWYEIRSCDAVRHFRDDLYLAACLVGHTIDQLFQRELRSGADQVWVDVNPGTLYFKAHSFHVHMGDYHLL